MTCTLLELLNDYYQLITIIIIYIYINPIVIISKQKHSDKNLEGSFKSYNIVNSQPNNKKEWD